MFERLKGALPDQVETDDRKKDERKPDAQPPDGRASGGRAFEGRRFDDGLPRFEPQPGGFGRRATPVGATPGGAVPAAAPASQAAAAMKPAAASEAVPPQIHGVAPRVGATGKGAAPALGDISTRIADWLMREVKDERGIHCETLLTAVGALAGYAAQQSLWEGMVKPGKMAIREAFQVVETHSGQTYFFGDILDNILASMEPKQASIWKIVAGGTLAAGGEHLPDIGNLFRHCAATAGTAEFGLPRLPDEHLPSILPCAALDRLWPGARLLLALAEPLTWPQHMAAAAQKLMLAMKGTIAPDLAVKIVMEAAVPMSRVDPTTVPND